MPCAQRAAWGKAHHQVRGASLHIVVEHAHDMGMLKTSDRLGLAAKCVDFLTGEGGTQDLDGSEGSQVQVLTEVDLGEATLTKQANEAIAAQQFSHTAAPGVISL